MALRVLFILIGFILVVNIILIGVGLIFNVNLYRKYSKQILNFFIAFALLIILLYVILAFLGLID